MIADDDTNWGTKSLVVLDMPFTAVVDTLLLPWDLFRKDSSVRSRVEQSEEKTLATRKVAYAQEAAQQYDGPVLVPDDLEVIPLD